MSAYRVGIAEYRLASAPEILAAHGLGSCVAVTLYDPVRKVGGLAHALLPAPVPEVSDAHPATYVATAVQEMVVGLEGEGSSRADLVAKLVGGSRMFDNYNARIVSVGERNLEKAFEVLAGLGIPVHGQETGGNCGRSLEFDLNNGEVKVRKVRAAEPTVL